MSEGGRRPDEPEDRTLRGAWSVLSYLLTGMLLYGGLGWLLGRWLEIPALFVVGSLVGLALAIYLVYVRYGR